MNPLKDTVASVRQFGYLNRLHDKATKAHRQATFRRSKTAVPGVKQRYIPLQAKPVLEKPAELNFGKKSQPQPQPKKVIQRAPIMVPSKSIKPKTHGSVAQPYIVLEESDNEEAVQDRHNYNTTYSFDAFDESPKDIQKKNELLVAKMAKRLKKDPSELYLPVEPVAPNLNSKAKYVPPPAKWDTCGKWLSSQWSLTKHEQAVHESGAKICSLWKTITKNQFYIEDHFRRKHAEHYEKYRMRLIDFYECAPEENATPSTESLASSAKKAEKQQNNAAPAPQVKFARDDRPITPSQSEDEEEDESDQEEEAQSIQSLVSQRQSKPTNEEEQPVKEPKKDDKLEIKEMLDIILNKEGNEDKTQKDANRIK